MKKLLRLIRVLLHRFGIDIVRYRPPFSVIPDDFDAETASVIRSVRAFTMTSNERIGALCDAVSYVCKARIEGAIVECGVWRGGSMMAVAQTLIGIRQGDRQLYLFDTFEGMPPPTSDDIDPSGISAEILFGSDGRSGTVGKTAWVPESIEGVQNAMRLTGYDMDLCHLVKGKVEETIPSEAPDTIAILRLDTDWYKSTRHELEHLVHRISEGGILIIDDYGYWQGARKAVDDFMAESMPPHFMHRIDATGRLIVIRQA